MKFISNRVVTAWFRNMFCSSVCIDGRGEHFPEFAKKNRGKVSQFLGSGEEFDEIQFQACCRDLGLGSVNYLEGNFSECKDE